MSVDFGEVFRRELEVVQFRRDAIREGRVAETRKPQLPSPGQAAPKPAAPPVHLRAKGVAMRLPRPLLEGPDRGTVRAAPHSDLTGLALSGGGIRSATFCLGVVQALDSLSDHDEPHVLDAVDYLSVVSGGGYLGTSLVAAMMQPDFTFPFDSRLDAQETPETRHLRDFGNFLAPNGAWDYAVSAALVLRGLVVNGFIVLPMLLIAAALTVIGNPSAQALGHPTAIGRFFGDLLARLSLPWPYPHFTATVFGLAVLVIGFLLSAVVASRKWLVPDLVARRRLGYALALLGAATGLAAFCEAEPFVLEGMLASKGVAPAVTLTGTAGDLLRAFAGAIPALASVLVPIAAVLVGLAQKLANVAKASAADTSWSGWAKSIGSRAALWAVGLIVPFLLWVAYLYLAYWGIADDLPRLEIGILPVAGAVPPFDPFAHAPGFLAALDGAFAWTPDLVATLPSRAVGYLLIAIAVSFVCLFIGPNANSLHHLYRDRLSAAYLFDRAELLGKALRVALAEVKADERKFSMLKPRLPPDQGGGWAIDCAYAPYLLVNTAINLEACSDVRSRGRNADTFVFSPLFVGSRPTGYAAIDAMEQATRSLGLASAMATSGAAASANMGAITIKPLTFSLSVLNVRLGLWLPNPRRLSMLRKRLWRRAVAHVGTWYFALETLGALHDKRLNVYLTDGGHIENLGVYELLRRKCSVILAVDAEEDRAMTFGSLARLQVMARIDLGVRIDLPWHPIRDRTLAVMKGDATETAGPHAAIGRIDYGEGVTGVLIYIKSSVSGDENDYVADYRRRHPDFPHQTTVDQFFDEEQFEAYRSLGFHAARGLFAGADRFGTFERADQAWLDQVEAALKLLNMSDATAKAVTGRM